MQALADDWRRRVVRALRYAGASLLRDKARLGAAGAEAHWLQIAHAVQHMCHLFSDVAMHRSTRRSEGGLRTRCDRDGGGNCY